MVIPIFLYFWYISVYGVNVFFWDDWEIVIALEKLYLGTLDLTYLFHQHTEHRLFFPYIFFIFLGNVTHGNMLVNMYFSAFLLVFILVIIFICWIRFSGSNARIFWDFLPVPFLLFTFSQYENTLHGFQITNYMVILFSVISFACLENIKKSNSYLILALISGVVASFSFLMGLLVWPVGMVYLFFHWKVEKEDRAFWGKKILIWLFIALSAGILYFFNLSFQNGHPSIFYAVIHPIEGITYFLSLIGSMIIPEYHVAIAFGIVIFVIYLQIIWKVFTLRNPSLFYLPFLLIFYSLFFDIVTTLGRSGFGITQSISSRYTIFNVLGLIGMYLLLLAILKGQKKENYYKYFSYVFNLVIVIIFLQIIFSYPVGIIAGENSRASRIDATYALLNYQTASDDIIKKNIYPEVGFFKYFAPIVENYELNVFSNESKYRGFNTNRSCPFSHFVKNISLISSKLNSSGCFRRYS